MYLYSTEAGSNLKYIYMQTLRKIKTLVANTAPQENYYL